jgi:hypothetical protein
MAADLFEKTSWSWQFRQFSQDLSEWVELQLSRFNPDLPRLPSVGLPTWFESFALWLTLVIAGAVFVMLVERLWRFFQQYFYAFRQHSTRAQRDPSAHAEPKTIADWMKQVELFRQQGNYREACRALYMALLQHLNDAQLILHQSSRTDGEYLQHIQQLHHQSILAQLQPYQTLIATHEQLCFGHADISQAEFQICELAYQQLDAYPAHQQEGA